MNDLDRIEEQRQLWNILAAGVGEAWENAWADFMESKPVKKARAYIQKKCWSIDYDLAISDFDFKLIKTVNRLAEKGDVLDSIDAFVMIIAKRVCADHIKRNLDCMEKYNWLSLDIDDDERPKLEIYDCHPLANPESVIDKLECEEKKKLLAELFKKAENQIRKEDLELVINSYGYEIPDKVYAQILGLNPNTVKSKRQRTIKKLTALVG